MTDLRKRPKLAPERRAAIVRDYAGPEPLCLLMHRYGLSKARIRDIAREEGVPPRPKGDKGRRSQAMP